MYHQQGGTAMFSSLIKTRAALLLTFALAFPLFLTGCRDRDADDYNRWERETHREHVDQARRSADEQRQYREWRERQDRR